MLINDLGGTSAPTPVAPSLPAPAPAPVVSEPRVEYLLDINFTLTPSPEEQAQLAATPVQEPVSSPAPEEPVSFITPSPEEQAQLAATPVQEPVSFITPTPEEQAQLAATLEQQANRSALVSSGGWNPWALAASGSTGGDWGDQINLGLDLTGLATDTLTLGARSSQITDGLGNGASILSLGGDLSQLGAGVDRLSSGDPGGLGDAAEGGSGATATGLDLVALASRSARLSEGAGLAGGVAIGVEGLVDVGQGLHEGDREQVALGAVKQAAATGIVAGLATGNPFLIGGGLGLYGGTVYWENRETINPLVAGAYNVVDSIPPWALPFAPAPFGTAIAVVQGSDDLIGAGKSLASRLPSVRVRNPFR